MTDILRIVTFSSGGRPIEVLNLNSAPGAVTAYFRDRDAGFQFTPGVPSVQYSKKGTRYGGAQAVGETHDNGSVGWTVYVRGTTLLAATQNVEALIVAINDAARGRFVEWAPEGGRSSFLEIAGPGTWTPVYNPVEFVQTNAMRVQLVFPVLPLVSWLDPTIRDPYDVDSTADYTYDSLTAANTVVAGGVVTASGGSLTTERRVRHTVRGYDFLEGQATVTGVPVTTITSFKVGVLLRATSASNYIEVYVDDNGTNSRLRIDVVIAGSRINRSTTNLGARLTTGAGAFVRGRIEGSVVNAEYFLSTPTPMGAPTTSSTYTLVVGDAPLNTVAGKSGWSWIPQNATSTVDNFEFLPFTWRNLTFPRTVVPLDAIPGTAPAKADVLITAAGGAAAPAWALVGWSSRVQTAVQGTGPFAVCSAVLGTVPAGVSVNTSGFLSNLTQTADAAAISGNSAKDATVSGAETYIVGWYVDPTTVAYDDFSASELTVEVWVRMAIASSVVAAMGVLSAESIVTGTGSIRYSNEWGTAGTLLIPPPGTFYRLFRLGTVTLPADPLTRRTVNVNMTVTTAVGSTGTFAVDYAIILPVDSRSLSPSAKLQNAAYPTFISTTNQRTKMIRSDLSATIINQVGSDLIPMSDHGLGGSLIEPHPGNVDWLMKLSNVVPDDPVPTAVADQLANGATLTIDVTPRSYLLRNTA